MDKRTTSARIRVTSFRPPRRIPDRHDPVRTVAPIRPVNLIGLVGAAWVLGAVLLQGTPHVLLASTSSGYGDVRYYEDCAYASLDGRMVHLRGGDCPLFRLLHEGR